MEVGNDKESADAIEGKVVIPREVTEAKEDRVSNEAIPPATIPNMTSQTQQPDVKAKTPLDFKFEPGMSAIKPE